MINSVPIGNLVTVSPDNVVQPFCGATFANGAHLVPLYPSIKLPMANARLLTVGVCHNGCLSQGF
jgi:hypothetical protein